ncbi:MAG: hypothetical protein KDJ25_12285 [Rhodoblastus sp.]|nr:hypothetical protein [Rhodoblastus sp.]
MLNFVGLGHSHIVALAKGAYALEAKGAEVGGRAICGRFRYLYDADFTPPFADEARTRLNPAIGAVLSDGAADFVLLSIGGNEHNVVSMRQPARRFDFILGETPDAPLDPKAEIVPEAAIRETLRDYMSENMRVLEAIRAASDLPMALVEPPPPLPRAQVLAYPKEFFRSQIDQRSMSPDILRRKVWRVQVGMMRRACAALGVAYIETPPDMFDADGLLKTSACGQDATHANESYGETMIELAARLMTAPAQGSG